MAGQALKHPTVFKGFANLLLDEVYLRLRERSPVPVVIDVGFSHDARLDHSLRLANSNAAQIKQIDAGILVTGREHHVGKLGVRQTWWCVPTTH